MYFKRYLILCGIFLIFFPSHSRILARFNLLKKNNYQSRHISHLSHKQRTHYVLEKDLSYLVRSANFKFDTYVKSIKSYLFHKKLFFQLIAHPDFNSLTKLETMINHFKYIDPHFKISDLKDKNDYNMIHLSALNSKTDFIDYFEYQGVLLNQTEKRGLSPLFLSIKESKSEEVIFHLLKKSSEDALTITDYEANNILHYLAESDKPSLKILDYLKDHLKSFSLKNMANYRNSSSLTPLAHSFKKLGKIYDESRKLENERKIELIKALIPITNPALRYKDEYLIHIAAQYSTKLEVFHLLVEHMKRNNLSVNLKGYKKRSVLNYLAAFNSNPEVLKFMIDQGALINAKDNENRTPLRSATRLSRNIDFVEILLDHHASLNQIDHHGKTAVYWFLRNKHFKKSPKFQKVKDRMLRKVQKPSYYRPEVAVY